MESFLEIDCPSCFSFSFFRWSVSRIRQGGICIFLWARENSRYKSNWNPFIIHFLPSILACSHPSFTILPLISIIVRLSVIEKQANSKRSGYHSGPPAKHEPVTSSLGNKNKKADREALGWINCSSPLGHRAIIFRDGGWRVWLRGHSKVLATR